MKVVLAVLFTIASMAYLTEGKASSSGCPPNKPVVNCFVRPCQVTDCPAFPETTCEDNYCGGCFAHFFVNTTSGKTEVTDGCYCTEPKDAGPCEAAMPRYYYDTNTKKCEFFYYGGCGGNRNNFKTKGECEAACTREYY